MRSFMAALMLSGTLAAALPAQSATPHSPRRTSLTAGLGNSYGWVGAKGERSPANGRHALFLGVGVTPELDPGDPSGITLAAGARAYTGGVRHRAFVELSVSQIGLETQYAGFTVVEGHRRYGPGAQLGYQYAALGGFTFELSGGAGYAVGTCEGLQRWQALLGLGIGYTWR